MMPMSCTSLDRMPDSRYAGRRTHHHHTLDPPQLLGLRFCELDATCVLDPRPHALFHADLERHVVDVYLLQRMAATLTLGVIVSLFGAYNMISCRHV